ncbi:MAG: ABC transporter ATP-binding protein [Clostridia bacterium]|nr:ABC transporter ATP-binding protein [Clostridia bacterium]
MLLQTDNLTVGYDGQAVIQDICLNVNKGEIVTLIGANGSGKSTILKTIAGYLEKICGSIFFMEKELAYFSRKEKAERFSVMLTEKIRTELMSCREVVETGRYPYTDYFGRLSQTDRQAVDEAIQLVDIESFADKDFSQISDGQRQRVLLAKAICQQPDILILDEPTSYLDIHHKIRFLEVIQKLAVEKQMAVLISMHELDFAEKISDYTIAVKDGKVVHYGKPQDIFTDENIRILFDIPKKLYDKYF